MSKLPEEFIKDYIDESDIDLEKFQSHRCKNLGYVNKNGWTWEDVLAPKEEFD